jgi:hypothetical protein
MLMPPLFLKIPSFAWKPENLMVSEVESVQGIIHDKKAGRIMVDEAC